MARIAVAHWRSCISALRPSSPCGRSMLARMRISPISTKRSAPIWPVLSGRCRKRKPLHHAPEQDGAQRHAAIAGEAAQDEHGIAEEGEGRIELAGIEIGDVEGEEEAGDGRQRRGDAERLQLIGKDVLAQRRGGILILPDRPQHPAPGTPLEQAQDDQADEEGDPDREEQRQLGQVTQADLVEAVQQPVGDVAPLLVEADDALIAAGEIGILEGVADDLGEGDGGDGEIVGAQPERGQPDQDAGQRRRSRWPRAWPTRATSRHRSPAFPWHRRRCS